MTIEEKYPNFAQLTALLNQRKRPRKTLDSVIACLLVRKSEGGGRDYLPHHAGGVYRLPGAACRPKADRARAGGHGRLGGSF